MEMNMTVAAFKKYTFDQDKTELPEYTVKRVLDALNRFSSRQQSPRVCPFFGNAELPVTAAHSVRFHGHLFGASGKGLSLEQCKASAAMEYLERYSWLHFNYREADGFTLAGYDDIKKVHRTVSPEYFIHNLIHVRDPQYLIDRISALPLKWIHAVSLQDGSKFFYPLNWHNYMVGSSGLGAGNNLQEAMLQALCEVVERENLYRFFGDERVAPTLDPSSVRHPGSRKLLSEAKEAGIQFTIKYLGFDFGIPTFIVRGIRADLPNSLAYEGVGQGTHPDPEKALIRGLTEYFEGMSQTMEMEQRLSEHSGTAVDGKKINWQQYLSDISNPNHGGFIANFRFHMLDRAGGAITMEEINDLSYVDISAELDKLVNILTEHGYEIFYVNKSHPALGVPVVRMFAPGMRSLVNGEIYHPFMAMSGVCHEAGKTKEADVFMRMAHMNSRRKAMTVERQYISMFSPNASNVVPRVFGEDYQQTFLHAIQSRKHLS